MIRIGRVVGCAALLVVTAGTLCGALEYRVTPLAPVSGYANSVASDVNDDGVVAGTSYVRTGYVTESSVACVWDLSGVRALQPLAGDTYSAAIAMNNSGLTVGYSSSASGSRACYWDSSGVHDLGALIGTGLNSIAADVNEHNQILVNVTTSGSQAGYIWDGSNMNLVYDGPEWDTGYCYALNNQGLVVGSAVSSTSPHVRTGGYWDQSGFHPLPPLEAGHNTHASAVNNCGIVAGASSGSTLNTFRACVWDTDCVHHLGLLSGQEGAAALGINERGVAVGQSYEFVLFMRTRAVLWDDTAPQLLPQLPGSAQSSASSINENDWIVGYCDGSSATACLWTPVPEPTSLVTLSVAVAGMVVARRRRK